MRLWVCGAGPSQAWLASTELHFASAVSWRVSWGPLTRRSGGWLPAGWGDGVLGCESPITQQASSCLFTWPLSWVLKTKQRRPRHLEVLTWTSHCIPRAGASHKASPYLRGECRGASTTSCEELELPCKRYTYSEI